MTTRKVQQLGPSTLAVTIPAKWAARHGVEKGHEVRIRENKASITFTPDVGAAQEPEVVVEVDGLEAPAIERAIIALYVLGRRSIHVERSGKTLPTDVIDAVYRAEQQVMGLGVVEETPERISVRCSVDPSDFSLEDLLQRLERTGSTMRDEAITALAQGDADLAQRALNRERQANKIFVLLLRLIFTTDQNPALADTLGLDDSLPLIGYRSVAKNLELVADNAQEIAEIVVNSDGDALEVDRETMERIRGLTDRVDAITELAVASLIERNYRKTTEVRGMFHELRRMFHELRDHEDETLAARDDVPRQELLRVRQVLVSLEETAKYAMRCAEIAANLALHGDSEHVRVQ